jgi:hypothetical protein
MEERKMDDGYYKEYILSMKDEAEQAKRNRMNLNKDNYSMYQLEHDFSHKSAGQSKEVLSKTRNATESSKAFFQQALADLDDWYRVTATDGTDGKGLPITPEEMQKMLNYHLKKADYFSHVGASTQSGLLGALAISKIRGELLPKPKFKTKSEGKGSKYKKHVVVQDDKTWELRIDNIRQEDYYPDPTGGNLYRIYEDEVDYHLVKALAEGDDAIYDKAAVADLQGWGDGDLQNEKKAHETGQNVSNKRMRKRVKLTEFWGTVVDSETGDIVCENVVATLANETTLIRKPTPNPLWHQRTPLVAAALIEFANSVWGIAMMDAGTKHNRSLIEVFNLMLDSALKAVWGVNQVRTDVLDDPTQITDGIKWGTNLKIGAGLPIGGKAMEPVLTGNIPPEVITMFNLLNQETLTSMKTNDLRMGAQSMRAVKATEVVAAENSITSEFQGIAKNFEEKKIQPELELATWTICQNWDLIDKEVFVSLYGKQRGEELSQLEPQDVFVGVVNGMKFEVYGISLTLRRQADFRKWTTLLQVIGGSEVLIEAFVAKYSFEKLIGEIMTAIDLNKSKIEHDNVATDQGAPAAPAPAQASMEQPGGAPGATPDKMSQVPSPANIPQAGGGLAAVFSGVGNQMNMPSAHALK